MPSARTSLYRGPNSYLATFGPPVVAVFAVILWCFLHLNSSIPVPAVAMSTSLPRRTLSPTLFNTSLVTSIHNLWFTNVPRHATAPIPGLREKWFGMGSPETRAAFDGECQSLFLPALSSVNPSNYPLPAFTSFAADRAIAPEISAPFRALPMLKTGNEDEKVEAVLGLVLLLDQMPRNIFRREEAKVVYQHYDRLSRALVYCIFHRYGAKDLGIEKGNDLADLYDIHRVQSIAPYPVRSLWFLLPLMHSESIDDHDLFTKQAKIMQQEAEDRGDTEGADFIDSSVKFEDKHRDILDQFHRYPHRNAVLGRETTRQEKEWLEGGGDTFGSG